MILYNISFDEYDSDNEMHKRVIDEISKDPYINNYYYDYKLYVDILLEDENNKLYVASLRQEPLGVIGLQKQNGQYLLSFALTPTKNGDGIGSIMVDAFSTALLKRHMDVSKIYLHVHPEKDLYRIVATRAGYTKETTTRYYRENQYFLK